MIKESVLASDNTLTTNRILGHIVGEKKGPTLVFFGGIHGNEPAGITALNEVLEKIGTDRGDLSGELYAIAGNLPALEQGVRFVDEDLNRIWLSERLDSLNHPSAKHHESVEQNQMMELLILVQEIVSSCTGPCYFVDLHTTSGDTSPFILINDTLLNRKFASRYPLPIILGIEEYLQGTFFNYINELGYVAMGFEGGSHQGDKVVENTVKFIEYTLALTGFCKVEDINCKALKNQILESSPYPYLFYEVFHQHAIEKHDEFEMLKGYVNFQRISKGKPLAFNNGEMIIAKKDGQIFMPLYQKKGQEGFYLIRKIPKFFLALSKYLRKARGEFVLQLFPGISRASQPKGALRVNPKVARLFSKQIFHLLGYRIRYRQDDRFIVKNREKSTKRHLYVREPWQKK